MLYMNNVVKMAMMVIESLVMKGTVMKSMIMGLYK